CPVRRQGDHMADRALTYDEIAVGDGFESAEIEIDEAAIIDFARAFDPQPPHVDPDAASRSFFGGLAASGWHTASVTMRLLVDSAPLGAEPIVGLGVEQLQWLKAVRPGDRLRIRGEVLEKRLSRSMPARGLVRVRLETLNQ